MKNVMGTVGIGLLLAFLIPVNHSLATQVKLDIDPVFQERPNWCWAAVGEMVFRYYDVPAAHQSDYQCGIVRLRDLCLGLPSCFKCDLPAGDASTVANMLTQYPWLATIHGTAGDVSIQVQTMNGSLTKTQVRTEIEANRPIIAGISPLGFKVGPTAQHVALITGYDDSSGRFLLIVNDPFPFNHTNYVGQHNPYVLVGGSDENGGQYKIDYDAFRSELMWSQTFWKITCSGSDCAQPVKQVTGASIEKDDRSVIQEVVAASRNDFKSLRGPKDDDDSWHSTLLFRGADYCTVWDKDEVIEARWSCSFRFSNRAESDQKVKDIVDRVDRSLPSGWEGERLSEKSETKTSFREQKYVAGKIKNTTGIRITISEDKRTGKASVHLSVDNN